MRFLGNRYNDRLFALRHIPTARQGLRPFVKLEQDLDSSAPALFNVRLSMER
jgi:hypothetical protein